MVKTKHSIVKSLNEKKVALIISVTSIFAALLFVSPATAEGRFTFEKAKNDIILRFDSQTGKIDRCFVEKGEVRCILPSDDRAELENEIAQLKAKIAELEAGKEKRSSVPSKKEIDQAFDMMQYFMQKFQTLGDDKTSEPSSQEL